MTEPNIDKLIAQYELRVPVAVGRATIAWNTLSYSAFQLYKVLSGMDLETAKATFFVVASDRSQRDMVSALIKAKLEKSHPELAKKCKTLLGKIDAISGKRNDIAHVVLLNEHSPAKVAQYHERGFLKGKMGTELLESIEKFNIGCLDIAIELLALTNEVEQDIERRKMVAETISESKLATSAKEWSQKGIFGFLDVPDPDPDP